MYSDDSPLIQFCKVSYTGYNSMRVRKSGEGYLSKDLYERFLETNLSVERVFDMDLLEFTAILGANHHRSQIPQ